jgi:hypothetical protein
MRPAAVEDAERMLLKTFQASVSDQTRSHLCDPDLRLPFANR